MIAVEILMSIGIIAACLGFAFAMSLLVDSVTRYSIQRKNKKLEAAKAAMAQHMYYDKAMIEMLKRQMLGSSYGRLRLPFSYPGITDDAPKVIDVLKQDLTEHEAAERERMRAAMEEK